MKLRIFLLIADLMAPIAALAVEDMPPLPPEVAKRILLAPSGGRVEIRALSEMSSPFADVYVQQLKRFEAGPTIKSTGERLFKSTGRIQDLDAYVRAVQPSEKVLPKTLVKLAELKGTAFESFTLLGYIPEGTKPGGPWTHVTRVFSAPPGELVTPSEYDFGLDDGGVLYVKELLNTEVNRQPATLVVTKNSFHMTQTVLTWASGTKAYTLTVMCKLANCVAPEQWLRAASTLPIAPTSKAVAY